MQNFEKWRALENRQKTRFSRFLANLGPSFSIFCWLLGLFCFNHVKVHQKLYLMSNFQVKIRKIGLTRPLRNSPKTPWSVSQWQFRCQKTANCFRRLLTGLRQTFNQMMEQSFTNFCGPKSKIKKMACSWKTPKNAIFSIFGNFGAVASNFGECRVNFL